jgi:hypothetical protein
MIGAARFSQGNRVKRTVTNAEVLNLCHPLSRWWRTIMDCDGLRFAAISEMTSFLHYFSGLPDHRQPGKVDYPFPEVLLLILLAVLAEAGGCL